MKQQIFRLDDQFKFSWMKKRGFWRLIWFALLAKFNIITTNKQEYDGCYYSIGSKKPLKDFTNNGYSSKFVGKILGERVYFYRKKFNNRFIPKDGGFFSKLN